MALRSPQQDIGSQRKVYNRLLMWMWVCYWLEPHRLRDRRPLGRSTSALAQDVFADTALRCVTLYCFRKAARGEIRNVNPFLVEFLVEVS